MLSRQNNISIFMFIVLSFAIMGCGSKSQGYYGNSSSRMINSHNMHRATMRPYVVNGKRYYPTRVSVGDRFSGMASWYGKDFHGKKTSNGEYYNMYALTAAHKILPMNTMVKVTNLLNNRSIIVRINDRGPFVGSRIIDLSYKAALRLGFAGRGTTPVRLRIIGFNGKLYKRGTYANKQYASTHKIPNIPNVTTVDVDRFLVQIGAFRNLANSKAYARRIKNKFGSRYKVLIKRSRWKKGGVIHRVCLRGFRSEEEARDLITSRHLTGAFITRDE